MNLTPFANPSNSFVFSYDNLSRLTSSRYYLNSNYSGRFDTSYDYDIMGNITSLQRCGLQADSVSYGVIDDLALTYSGNQLVSVSDAAIDEPTAMGAQHFHDGASTGAEYTYDANGNMTKDANSSILRITYDINNQPDSVRFSLAEAVRYYYDAMGNRLGSDEYTQPTHTGAGLSLPALRSRSTRRFCGNIIYDGSTISQILFDGGYITLNDNGSPIYHFYVTDHQGNNRLVVNANGTIEESNTYYPYGALINSTTNIQRFKYNGKELNQHSYMLWYDYMARQTMPILGRFSSVDPLCEKYYSMSPYAYCAGNPVRFVDRDGRVVEDPDNVFLNYKEEISNRLRAMNADMKELGICNVSSRFKAVRKEYKNILKELKALEKSNVIYRFEVHKELVSVDGNNLTYKGETGYDFVKSKVLVRVGTNKESSIVGHELKHAYQFEKGEISFSPNANEFGALTDIYDETSAYDRQDFLLSPYSSFDDNGSRQGQNSPSGVIKRNSFYKGYPMENRSIKNHKPRENDVFHEKRKRP